ncbi:MAG TPA: ATP-binding protein [Rhodocyclaceae bacterium]|nr:ATP-binding protein [Rhodocyclaceae bacterium]
MLQRCASRWPLVVALVFGAYAYLLIASVYRSQGQLKAEADQRIVADAKRQAAAVADLVAERRNGAVDLAGSPEVAHYLTNKALGMSLRYGLNVNLFEIEARFRRRLERTDLRGERIFRRIMFFDADGQALVDLTPGDGPIAPPVATGGDATVTVDTQARRIVIVVPVMYKDAQSGTVVAVGDVAPLSRNLVGVEAAGARLEFLVSGAGNILLTSDELRRLNHDFVRALAALPEGVLTPARNLAGGETLAKRSMALRTSIPGSDLSLLTIGTEDSLYGQITSHVFLYFASVFPLLLLAAAVMFDRMRRVERALARSELRFHAIFNDIKETVFILNAEDGAFVEANPSVTETFGYSLDEVPRLTPTDISSGQPGFAAADWSARMTATANEPQFFEWRVRRKNGELFWVGVDARRANIDGHERLLVVMRDITRRKEQEQELLESLEHQRQLNKRLEEAQTQLLQSEKMASIGQLAAGVAHEINNPVGFVNSNLATMGDYVADLMSLLGAYESSESALPEERRTELVELRKQLDVDYLRDDIGKLLKESMDGMQRVRRIVADLKDFSHVDQAQVQLANLEAGLDSTLNVVWNELKYKAEVVKEYAGVPAIECRVSQLNQVFMNLLVNAAQAIAEHGRIVVRTGFDDEHVWVEIEDSGAGIAPENVSRIFEPFFTTKPVGKGTGLGLSLSYGIVRKHHGEITVRSTLGVGSVFRVTLPRNRPPELAEASVKVAV